MDLLELTLESAAENVALDEALLEQAEGEASPRQCLRTWEPAGPMVVIGRGSHVAAEVWQDACHSAGVPILRRTSGGHAIVTAPGCLMYALILSYARLPKLRDLGCVHGLVLETLVAALRPLLPQVAVAGISDLALQSDATCKFSGNSLRCGRRCLMYHGTLLYGMRLELLETYLKTPPRQPAYRQDRSHAQFVANAPCTAAQLRNALIQAWQPTVVRTDWPWQATRQLVAEKYGRADWNYRH